MPLEISEIENDLRICGIPKEEAERFAKSYARAERYKNFISLATIGTLIVSLCIAYSAVFRGYSLTHEFNKYVGLPLSTRDCRLADASLTALSGLVAVAYLESKERKNKKLIPFLQATAENERARKRGEPLPHDENIYNPQNLARML